MPEERDELEQAWQALTARERLVQETVARRSAEIDARATKTMKGLPRIALKEVWKSSRAARLASWTPPAGPVTR